MRNSSGRVAQLVLGKWRQSLDSLSYSKHFAENVQTLRGKYPGSLKKVFRYFEGIVWRP